MGVLASGSVFAGYRVEAVAGRGGMGVVYRARQLRPSRLVAVKVIAPELASDPVFRQRFERESDLAASIEHPNVIPVYEVDEADGLLFLAMRFVEGADLGELIDEGLEPLPAVQIVEQVGAALDAAHARGLVHRDVKPSNVLVSEMSGGRHAYLTDFGLTKRAAASAKLTESGMFLGTVDYAAPEQIQAKRVDARTDVYALTCVLFEALTGHVPYPRDSHMATIWAHVEAPPPSVVGEGLDLPAGIDEVIRRGMAKDPDDRYPSAGDLARAALAVFQDRPIAMGERTVAAGDAARAPGGVTTLADPHQMATERLPQRATQARATRVLPRPPIGRRLLLAAAATAVLGVVAAAVLALGDGGSREEDGSPSATVAGTVVGDAISVPGGPRAIAAGAGSVWVTTEERHEVVRIDAASGRVRGDPIPVGRVPSGVAVGEGFVWVTNADDGTVTRIHPRSGRVRGRPIRVGRSPADVAVGFGSAWTANWIADTVSRIDPRTGRVVTIAVGDGPWDVATGAGAVWVANVEGDTLSRINPASNRVVGSAIPVRERPESVTVGAGSVWVANVSQDTVTRVDPVSNAVDPRPIEVGQRPDDLVVAQGALYVVNQDADTLMKVDATSGRVVGRAVQVGNAPGSITAASGLLWIANFQSQNVVRVRASRAPPDQP